MGGQCNRICPRELIVSQPSLLALNIFPCLQVLASAHQGSVTESITIHNVDQLQENIPEVMSRLTRMHRIPQVRQMQLLTRLRLARNFPRTAQRRKCVMARLQAISILGEELYTFPMPPIGCVTMKLYATSEWPTCNLNIHRTYEVW